MAIKDKATFIAEVQKIADALNNAMAENGGTEMAVELLNPSHPLRQVDKLFNLDSKTGEISADNVYISQSYMGYIPEKGTTLDMIIDSV
jgi:hypothetical protein